MLGRDLNSDANDNVAIDLSPMIDCIFILLIFFIVTTVFVDEVGTEVNKPDISSATASTLDSNSVIIEIGADENEVTLLDDAGSHRLPRATKDWVAQQIISYIAKTCGSKKRKAG